MRILYREPIIYNEAGEVSSISPMVYVEDFKLPILMFAIRPPIQAAFIKKQETFYDFADPAVFLGLKPAPMDLPTESVMKKAIYRLESTNQAGVSRYRFLRVE